MVAEETLNDDQESEMSAKTRIRRDTTATPRKQPAGRLVFQSTNIFKAKNELGEVKTIKLKGRTFQPDAMELARHLSK